MGLFDKFKKKPNVSQILKNGLNDEKRDMIRGIVDLSDTAVKEVMIPRIDVDFLSLDTPGNEILDKISESGHSRFPVYEDSIDNVIGILYVKDILKLLPKNEKIDLKKVVRKAFFVPESKRIDDLLREFKRRHLHIAIAVDEYGGTSGIVCMEDIIEEIVGDIQDEFDNEGEDITKIGDGVWLCDARIDLDDLKEAIDAEDLPADEFETLGGFVFDLFGKIPVKYEKAVWQNYDFIVQDMDGHKVKTVKIILNKEALKPEAE
ncbi:hemolysin family protein [Treponema pedis]|uniref:hemolysin family protein n=1 Tax=Treponema pedis TaxID=409322 RepID=UPI000419C08E|nr:hemolysin family protein [Treponema pedis]